MAHTHPGACTCDCCSTGKCICPRDGKDCDCECCKRRSCTCSAQQQGVGGQHQPCKCPCCEKKSCTCKKPSDCACPCCQKHECLCPSEAEKKKTEACNCCCCKSNSQCCTEARHQQSCDCRCCKEQTCKCCKSKKAGAAACGAQPAAGKTVSDVVYDSYAVSDSSGRRPHWQAGTFYCSRHPHWNNNCSSRCRYCRSCTSSHVHCCTSQVQYCRSSSSQRQCINTYGNRGAEEDTATSSSGNCAPAQSTACPRCCILPLHYRFTAPHFASCGCPNRQHRSYWQSPVHPCAPPHCCTGHTNSICWSCNSMNGVRGSTVVRTQGGAHVVEASQPCGKHDCSALFQDGSGKSSSSAAEQDSVTTLPVEHSYAPEPDFSCAECHCCGRGPPTGDVGIEKHELQREQRFREAENTLEGQHGGRTNQQQQQVLQKDDDGQKRNSCILEPAGRLLFECKTKEQVILRRMQPSDYPAVRALLPLVSRCTLVLSDQEVHDVLSSPVFYAWCCYTVEPTPLRPQHQRQEETQARAENQQEEVEKQLQHPANEQQTQGNQQQSQQRQEQGRQPRQETKEDIPEFYREKKLVAYCELVLQPRLGRKTDGRLERVVVDDAFRGRGVASQMCAAVLSAVKERGLCGFVDLTVEKDEARHIYEDKLGFREVNTIVLRRQL